MAKLALQYANFLDRRYNMNMMKKALILSLLLCFTHQLFAANKTLVCLGKEELQIHKNKDKGPYYKLNQDMISGLVQMDKAIRLRAKFYKKVCHKSSLSPSLLLLKEILIHKDKVFYISAKGKKTLPAKSMIKETVENSYKLFIKFLSNIQSFAPTPDCITTQIPQLVRTYEQLQFIQEEVGIKRIIDEIKQKDRIFIKLENLDRIYKKCQRAKKQ